MEEFETSAPVSVSIPAPHHDVPVGPLAVHWLTYSVPSLRAGISAVGRVGVENAGSATWRSQGKEGVQIAYHWLDGLGNPIVWDGNRTPLETPIHPGESMEVPVRITAPMPPGPYRLALDLVHEHRFWFTEIGNSALEIDCEIRPLLEERLLVVETIGDIPDQVAETRAALASQEEPIAGVQTGKAHLGATAYLAAGCMPEPDWSRRVLDSHAEGFVAVGGAVEIIGGWRDRRAHKELSPWKPGFGRVRDWPRALICPSLLTRVPLHNVSGLPAVDPENLDGPTACDGRIRVRLQGDHRPI